MIEKTTKSGFPVGIALLGAFATIAGIDEIVVGLPGNYFGIPGFKVAQPIADEATEPAEARSSAPNPMTL